jgi:hypothetical protein
VLLSRSHPLKGRLHRDLSTLQLPVQSANFIFLRLRVKFSAVDGAAASDAEFPCGKLGVSLDARLWFILVSTANVQDYPSDLQDDEGVGMVMPTPRLPRVRC